MWKVPALNARKFNQLHLTIGKYTQTQKQKKKMERN